MSTLAAPHPRPASSQPATAPAATAPLAQIPRAQSGRRGGRPAAARRLAAGSSVLCADEATRSRMLDMESHLRPARTSVFLILAGTILVLIPWIGWWPLAPFAGAVVVFRLADALVERVRLPEYCFMGAWAFAQAMIGLSAAATGGPRSLFLPWLAIPAATLSARFDARGVLAGVAWTAAIIVAVTVGLDPAAVLASPQRLLVPLTLLAGVTLLSTALMHSDVKHRAAAAIDPLTGLFNRQALAVRAGELLEQARVAGTPLASVIGDLDHFKRVNDHHGHLVGDAVLREVANTLRSTLRTFDYVYRYGGEEFVILLPGNDEASALASAERLREAIARARPAGLEMTMSFGVGVGSGAEHGLDELLIAADRALYRAKAEGRNRVCVGQASGGVSLQAPQASLAAREAERRPVAMAGGVEASPAGAFAAARQMYLMGERVDMDVLAERLGVSRETLREWCGEREELLGEVLASLSQALLAHAVAENRHVTGGVGRLLAVYRQFVCTLVNAQPLQIFLQQEPQAALQILTSSSGHVQPRLVRSIHELLSQEQEAGAFALKTDARSLAYAIVRLTEAFLYNDAILATEPQIERAVRLVALLID